MSLDHPGIASLLDAGVTDDGTPYFIMDFVQGESITGFCDRARLGVAERIQLFLQVCDAVHCAHGRKVVHRDLKPANILVTPDGQARLLNFGIAKALDDDSASASTVTQWGGIPMTPSYASPEQLAGDAIGLTSDVYQLARLRAITPSHLQHHLSGALDSVVLEALQRAPELHCVPEPAQRFRPSSVPGLLSSSQPASRPLSGGQREKRSGGRW